MKLCSKKSYFKFFCVFLPSLMGFVSELQGVSIAEKKAALKSSSSDLDGITERQLQMLNDEVEAQHARLRQIYHDVYQLYQSNANEDQYLAQLDEANQIKYRINQLQQDWRDCNCKLNRGENYGLWHAPETTLEQLVIDYGSQDYVYLIPPEVGSIKVSVDSNLPIPRSCWNEMLELILSQNGVGVKTLNPYLRQLYLIKQCNAYIKMITNCREELDILPCESRVAFLLSPEPSEVGRAYLFLEKFINPATTVLQSLGRDILLIGQVEEVRDLLKLYDFVATNRGDREYRLIPVRKIKAEEMAKILGAVFDQSLVQSQSRTPGMYRDPSSALSDSGGLKVIVLQHVAQALFIVGTKEELKKAEEIICNVQSQLSNARDKVIFRYTVKHSDAEELAEVLSKVYNLMIATGTGAEENGNGENRSETDIGLSVEPAMTATGVGLVNAAQKQPPDSLYGQEGFYQEGGYVVNPAPAQPGLIPPEQVNSNRDNFIVDAKSGSIVMVLESDLLAKIKELLKSIDIPKKMVQIETLLFEKILDKEKQFGLNLLRAGSCASNTNTNCLSFNNICPYSCSDDISNGLPNLGIFEFLFSQKRTCSGIAPFDFAYRFLLSQDNVQINSSPSILAVNQTPATISVTEDLSINTGVFEVETAKGVTLKDAYTRAQYGITISIKPTIHYSEENDPEGNDNYVNLETDITFDTIHHEGGPNKNRPIVTRRHITNEVQVPNGETVILGGLRRKIAEDRKEAIPFLGELPGIGKLFSFTSMKDHDTEMFIFITPQIIKDPKEELECLKQKMLCHRPGDIPYFLECLEQAYQYESNRILEGSLSMLIGRSPPRYYKPSDLVEEDCCEDYE